MMDKILKGNCKNVLKTLPAKLVNCCVTSPPYYGLRDYGEDEQVGLEDTPEKYVERIVDIFREVKRVLKDDGTLWLNLGDSYNGNKKGNPETNKNPNVVNDSFEKKLWKGAKTKDLIGIPWMVAFALRADGWYLRQDIIWHKPNPMPESVKDRCTKSHEYIFLLSKSNQYYYDHNAIKEPYTEPMNRWGGTKLKADGESMWDSGTGHQTYRDRNMRPDENGKNKRSVWTVNTKPFKKAHFAVFPEKLIEPCILAGCPKDGIVLDPFIGSGTTGKVARKYHRNFIGIELNKKYIDDIANDRTQVIQPVLDY